MKIYRLITSMLALAALSIVGCGTNAHQWEDANLSMLPAVTAGNNNIAGSDATSKSIPGSLTSTWITHLSAGGPAVLDAATIQNVDTDIDNATTIELDCGGFFSEEIAFRLGYSGTPSVPLVCTMWGRTSSSEAWMPLTNLNGDFTMVFTPNLSSDVTDGTLYYTRVDPVLHVINRHGCDLIRLGVTTAFNGTVTNTSVVHAKAVR